MKNTMCKLPMLTYCHISDAATCGKIDYLEKILKSSKKATVNHAIHTACCGGCFDLVEWLLEKGADPNIKDEYNKTPLYWIVAGDGWDTLDRERTNKPEEYIKLLELMISKGLILDPVQIEMARKKHNSNYEYLKPVFDKYNNAAYKIQKQLRKSMYDPRYKMCQNIMKKNYNNI